MVHESQLSVVAQQRLAAGLPALLLELRARRRRRQRRRAGVAAMAVCLVVWSLGLLAPPSTAGRASRVPLASASSWQLLDDDSTVLARCVVGNRERREWLLDDAALRVELRAAGRPDGLVCVGNRVFVSSSAVDPWPETPLDPAPASAADERH
jgi:hypothetical protein